MSSGDLEYAIFTRSEMDRRYSRARDLMGRQGIDVLLITGEENFQYFAGTTASIGPHYSLARPSIFLLPMNREPIILTQNQDLLPLGSYVTDVREYFNVLEFHPKVVVDALRDAKLENSHIGVELGQEQRMGIPVGSYLELVKLMPKAQFVDAAGVIVQLRMVKSKEELDYIRQAADVTGRARQRLFDEHIVPGMTERDVIRTLRALIQQEGGDRTSFAFLHHGLLGFAQTFPYERPLVKGTVLGIDAGAFVRMYTVDYCRFAVLGKATDEQKRTHEIVKKISNKMAEALRPGITCSEIHRVGAKAIEDEGSIISHPQKLSGKSRMGHGQGMLFTEPPSITPADHTVLEVGMVLSTEPAIAPKGSNVTVIGNFVGEKFQWWEDIHVITEDGHEQITLESAELREIPF